MNVDKAFYSVVEKKDGRFSLDAKYESRVGYVTLFFAALFLYFWHMFYAALFFGAVLGLYFLAPMGSKSRRIFDLVWNGRWIYLLATTAAVFSMAAFFLHLEIESRSRHEVKRRDYEGRLERKIEEYLKAERAYGEALDSLEQSSRTAPAGGGR